jgi:hypothetical protein
MRALILLSLIISFRAFSLEEIETGKLHIKVNKNGNADAPEYLYIGYSGLNVYGSQPSSPWDSADKAFLWQDFEGIGAVYKAGHMIWARPNAKAAVKEWMKDDRSMGGRKCRNVILFANSWGAMNSTVLARWFKEEYGIPVRLHAIVEGVSRNTRPYNKIGPAVESLNIYSKEKHWPRGADIEGAINVPISTLSEGPFGHHVDAEWLGKSMVERKILEVLKKSKNGCDH